MPPKRKPQPVVVPAVEITPAHEVMPIEFPALEMKAHMEIIGQHLADGWQIAGWAATGGLRSVLLVRVPKRDDVMIGGDFAPFEFR